MTLRFNAIGMIASDMAATLVFYRMLGLDIPGDADTEGHVEAVLPGGPCRRHGVRKANGNSPLVSSRSQMMVHSV